MKRYLAWLITLLPLLAAATPGLAQATDLIRLPPAEWQIHAADDPACATSAPSCIWHNAQDLEVANANAAVLWIRNDVLLPPSLQSAPQLSLFANDISSPYEVYINGQRIGSVGDMAKMRGPWDSDQAFLFPASLVQNGRVIITVRLTSLLGSAISGTRPLLLGTPAAVHDGSVSDTLREFAAQWQHYLCFLVVFCVGVFFLFLYALDRQSPEYLWLGLLFVGTPLRRFFELATLVPMGFSNAAGFGLYNLLDPILFIANIEFPFALIRKPVWKSFRVIQIISCLDLSSLLFLLPVSVLPTRVLTAMIHTFATISPVTAVAFALTPLAYLVPLPACFRSPRPEMRWIGGAIAFLFIEDFTRFLDELNISTLLHVPSIPQAFPMGPLIFDVRAFAYLLFALVMLVTMTVRFRRMQSRNREMESELEAAHTVQQILIPEAIAEIPGLTIESAYLPASEVGGDFFQILPQPDQSTLIILGDVSGHGLHAAMTVSLLVGTIRTLAEYVQSPAELLAGLNRRLVGRSTGFATCLVLHITNDGFMTIANAGHLSPYLDGAEIPTEANLPLGLTLDVIYPETILRLAPDQHLTLLTDGVLEAANTQTRELFGFTRMQEISRRSAQHIAETARAFGQNDDITVLTLLRA